MSLLTCPTCFHKLSVPLGQLGRVLPCPLCKTMLVAVESFDQPKSKNPEEPQLVLIQAPVVLDVMIAETIDSTSKEPERLAPLLACPSCNSELRVDESKVNRPFRCPLCLRLLIAKETSDPSGRPGELKRIMLQKAPPGAPTPLAGAARGSSASEEGQSSFSAQQGHARGPEIWPTAPMALRWKADLVVRMILYAILYLGLIVLLVGVYRQDWFVSATTFFLVGFAFFALVGRKLSAKHRERNLGAQLRFLTGRGRDGAHWVSKIALVGFVVLLLGEAVAGVFAAVQLLEAPDDFYLVSGIVAIALAIAAGTSVSALVRLIGIGIGRLRRYSRGDRAGNGSKLGSLS
jgi:uncharacterized protein YbaR (Trm112 family)